MKLNERSKKRLAVTGCVILCGVLAVAIGSQFGGVSEAGQPLTESTTVKESVQVEIETINETEKPTEAKEPETELIVDIKETTVESTKRQETPAASVPAQTDKTDQAIQPAPERPSAPPEEVLQNPTQKPNGESVEGTPEAVPHGEVVQPSEALVQPGEPQAGDTQNGQIYIPGFGWVENQGGGGSGTTAGDMYENGNKIGIMD